MELCRNGQTKIDYLIGLRSGDIGDYMPPSERIYTQVFNQTSLPTLVYVRYLPQINHLKPDDESRSNGPFYYRVGPFFGVSNRVHHHQRTRLINLFTVFLASMVDYFNPGRCYFNGLIDRVFALLSVLPTTVSYRLSNPIDMLLTLFH